MSDTVLAALSGVLLGCAFPPVDAKWLVWVGLVPLLVAVHQSKTPRRAALLGWLAGVVFFLIVLHPLVSSVSWQGWDLGDTRKTVQWRDVSVGVFLHGLWVSFSAFSALGWTLWAGAIHRWHPPPILTAALWLLGPEWLRSQATFGFEWAFLGNACADWPSVRQLASLGGVPMLSALVVLVNCAFAAPMIPMRPALRRRAMMAACVGIGLAVGWGLWVLSPRGAFPHRYQAAAIQHDQRGARYNEIGLIAAYVPLMDDSIRRGGARVIVLPELIAVHPLTLDGSRPAGSHADTAAVSAEVWHRWMAARLQGTPAVLLAGVETVEGSALHNTMGAWTSRGLAGWYHKQRLVPFGEYQPWAWRGWAARGASQYAPEQGSQLLRAGDLVIGAFICQEILFSDVTRRSVRDGATLLVSGANDGVFANPAVARVHADLAQLRAVETGRYLIRPTKIGIGAIVDPFGRELAVRGWGENGLLEAVVTPLTARTPFVRWGAWPLWLAGVVILVIAVRRRTSA